MLYIANHSLGDVWYLESEYLRRFCFYSLCAGPLTEYYIDTLVLKGFEIVLRLFFFCLGLYLNSIL